MTYTEGFKARMIQRMTGPEALSAWALSREGGIVKFCGWRCERHAATLMPSLNCTPRMTSLRSACPLSFRHLRSAA